MRSQRDLVGPTQATAIRDLLQGIFVAELVRPSRTLWLASAWISDIPVVDNTALRFASLEPEWSAQAIPLSRVLISIARRGAEVVVIARTVPTNRAFMDRLADTPEARAGRIKLVTEATFHEKGLLGDDYSLDGSMNFTFNGITVNDEHLVYRTEPAVVAERHLVMEARWRERLT